jgi:hypothetical protein
MWKTAPGVLDSKFGRAGGPSPRRNQLLVEPETPQGRVGYLISGNQGATLCLKISVRISCFVFDFLQPCQDCPCLEDLEVLCLVNPAKPGEVSQWQVLYQRTT